MKERKRGKRGRRVGGEGGFDDDDDDDGWRRKRIRMGGKGEEWWGGGGEGKFCQITNNGMVYSIWCITRNNILGEKGARSVFFFSGIVGSKGSELGSNVLISTLNHLHTT